MRVAILILLFTSIVACSSIDEKERQFFESYLTQVGIPATNQLTHYVILTPKTCLACTKGVAENYELLLNHDNIVILLSGKEHFPEGMIEQLDNKPNVFWDSSGNLERQPFTKGGTVVVTYEQKKPLRYRILKPENFKSILNELSASL